MKKCIVASDSFKGSLSSTEITRIARQVIPNIFPGCRVDGVAVADGGEGTVDCFLACTDAVPVEVTVSGPMGEPVTAQYARRGEWAVVEMASAAGLPLVAGAKDPSRATTYGVGQLIAHAVDHGCKKLLLGLGGSATNDGGCGCAAALGAVFRDETGTPFCPTGGTLDRIAQLDLSPLQARMAGVALDVMCDVTNPLYGQEGAAYVFAPQKGATPEMVELLDRNLRRFDALLQEKLGRSFASIPGAGAAGGMGAGCVALLGGTLKPGIEAILDSVGFDSLLDSADLVITGEGRLDSQSLQGKVISGVAKRAHAKGVPVIALVGDVDNSGYQAYDIGVDAIFSINRLAIPFSQAVQRSPKDYRRTLEDVMRLIRLTKNMN